MVDKQLEDDLAALEDELNDLLKDDPLGFEADKKEGKAVPQPVDLDKLEAEAAFASAENPPPDTPTKTAPPKADEDDFNAMEATLKGLQESGELEAEAMKAPGDSDSASLESNMAQEAVAEVPKTPERPAPPKNPRKRFKSMAQQLCTESLREAMEEYPYHSRFGFKNVVKERVREVLKEALDSEASKIRDLFQKAADSKKESA